MPGAEYSCIPVADGMYVPGKRFISLVERETIPSNAILTSAFWGILILLY